MPPRARGSDEPTTFIPRIDGQRRSSWARRVTVPAPWTFAGLLCLVLAGFFVPLPGWNVTVAFVVLGIACFVAEWRVNE